MGSRRNILNFGRGNPEIQWEGRRDQKKSLPSSERSSKRRLSSRAQTGHIRFPKFEAALTQQANKAASGDPNAFRVVLRLREKVQEQEPYLSPAPEFVVNFIDPVTKKPVTTEDFDK
jgi:hypothetical protein